MIQWLQRNVEWLLSFWEWHSRFRRGRKGRGLRMVRLRVMCHFRGLNGWYHSKRCWWMHLLRCSFPLRHWLGGVVPRRGRRVEGHLVIRMGLEWVEFKVGRWYKRDTRLDIKGGCVIVCEWLFIERLPIGVMIKCLSFEWWFYNLLQKFFWWNGKYLELEENLNEWWLVYYITVLLHLDSGWLWW
jgi:hypothetical protein